MEPATQARRYSPQFEQIVRDYMARGNFPTEEELFSVALQALDVVWRQHEELETEIQRRVAESDAGKAKPLDIEAFLLERRQSVCAVGK